MKLIDILNEDTTRLNDYYVPQYFKSRAPYTKRDIGNNIENIYDKDGILVAVFNRNNIREQPSGSWYSNHEIIKWYFDIHSRSSKNLNPPIMVSKDFIIPLLDLAEVKNPESKRGFNWQVWWHVLNYFKINRKEKNPDGEDTFIDANSIAISNTIKGSPMKFETKPKEKGQYAASRAIVVRKKEMINKQIKETTQVIKTKMAEIKQLAKQIELLKRQIKSL